MSVRFEGGSTFTSNLSTDREDLNLTTITNFKERIRPVPLTSPHSLNLVAKKQECKRIDDLNKQILLKLTKA
jgi:hypothetical protein